MKCVFVLVAFALVAAASANPAAPSSALVTRQRRDVDIFDNTRRLIEELVQNLQAAANQAIEAVKTFGEGIRNQVELFQLQIQKSIEDLRERVRQAIDNITTRIQNISDGLRDCVESNRQIADSILNDTLSDVGSCVDDQVNRIGNLFAELTEVSDAAIATGNEAVAQMRECSEKHQGQLLQMGSCLSNVVFQTQGKAVGYGARSAMLVTRINLAMGTLPAALQLCAGARLVEAGARIGGIVIDVGRCAVRTTVSNLTG